MQTVTTTKKKKEPWPFQLKAKNDVTVGLEYYRSFILKSPTSSGKTFMASLIIEDFLQKNPTKHVWFFVHLDNLFQSTQRDLFELFNPLYVQCVTDKVRLSAKIHICMIQTFNSRFENKGWKQFLHEDFTSLVVFDECHRGEHDKVQEYLKKEQPNVKVLGLTGTPRKEKNAKFPLFLGFDRIIGTVSEIELINMKQCLPPNVIFSKSDLSGIENIGIDKKTGDYNSSQASKFMQSKSKIYLNIFDKWEEFCKDTKTLVFGCDIDHCVFICNYLEKRGLKSKFVSSEMAVPKHPEYKTDFSEDDKIKYEKDKIAYQANKERYDRYVAAKAKGLTGNKNAILKEWGKSFHILVNAALLATGFDDPTIKTAVLLRPILSENLYLQAVARAKRYFEGMGFYWLLDGGGNIGRHGLPTQHRNYPLQMSEKSKKKGDRPMKSCPQCNQVVPASDLVCCTPTFENFVFTGICGYSFRTDRPERETTFSVMEWNDIIELNGKKAGEKFVKSKKTTVSDVYEYWYTQFQKTKDTDKPFSHKWLFYTLFEKFGRDGLVELAEITGRNPDTLLDQVQRETTLNVYKP